MPIRLWLFRELFQNFPGNVAKGDLCLRHPLLPVPFRLFFLVENHSVRGIHAVGLPGEPLHHLDAVLVVFLQSIEPYWFFDDFAIVLEDGIAADQHIPLDSLLLETLQQLRDLPPAGVLT